MESRGTKARRHEGTKAKSEVRNPKSEGNPKSQIPIQNPKSKIQNLPPNPQFFRAFTLPELLIVIALIVLILALALPAFNLLRGGKSIQGAENQIGSFIARARAEAIGTQTPHGACLYYDPVNQVNAMTIVEPVQGSPWSNTVTYSKYAYVTISVPTGNIDSPPATPTPKPNSVGAYIVHYYVSKVDNNVGKSPTTDTTGAFWADSGTQGSVGNWTASVMLVDIPADETDALTLPSGVGVQLINDYTYNPDSGATPPPRTNAYVSLGAIMFDGSGRFINTGLSFPTLGRLGTRINLRNGGLAPSPFVNCIPPYDYSLPPDTPALLSQFGVVLYDRQAFLGAGGSEWNTSTQMPFQSVLSNSSNTAYSTTSAEGQQEVWLATNTTPLLINRYNGSIIRGE